MLEPNISTQCVSVNEQLWVLRRDPTTQLWVWGLFAFFYSMIIICGCLGNLCVILAISRTKSLQTVPNMFIFSLSCSDFMVCLTSATITPITAFAKVWLFGSVLCSVAPFLAGTSLSFSTFTLAAISIDRFMLIRFPMKKPFSHTQAFMIICLICTMAMGLSMPVALMHTLTKINNYCGMYCFEDWGPYSSQRRAYGTIVLSVQFIIPLSIIIVCYTAISVRLGQSMILKGKKRDYQWQLQMNDQHRAATKRRQRTNRMFIAMVVAFSLSWVWSVVFNVLKDYELLPAYVLEKEYIVGISLHCMAMTSTVWNPLLYAMMNLQLRAAFIQLMPLCIKEFLAKEEDPQPMAQSCKPRPSSLLSPNGNIDQSNLPSGCQTPRNGWLTPNFFKTGPRNSISSMASAFQPNGLDDGARLVRSTITPTKYGAVESTDNTRWSDEGFVDHGTEDRVMLLGGQLERGGCVEPSGHDGARPLGSQEVGARNHHDDLPVAARFHRRRSTSESASSCSTTNGLATAQRRDSDSARPDRAADPHRRKFAGLDSARRSLSLSYRALASNGTINYSFRDEEDLGLLQ
ncbi:unnamed protein product [Bursaphelenchus okinawaensis]|uniref:G-protein coupled receptors family 1 profile domain-containing protein n=1 Tax=Bursaphelenchus okinawaensis TaxID=465554 RepID=A0A811LQD8_9BILA|nr:unnamed protein product [Bursaphelenchus okinawaensis]CAG9127299.1 unnamed protein product [Bursaphelenchus okinawaensis]